MFYLYIVIKTNKTMATRSTIWKQQKDGTFKGIYCHWDGYPSNNGKILLDSYQDEEKIDELISLGSISQLKDEVKPDGIEPHSYDKPQENVVIAYHRDRGENLNIYQASSIDELKLKMFQNHFFEEYNYIWLDGKWHLGINGKELTHEICEKMQY